jgi:CheY-like chemotaxis protein
MRLFTRTQEETLGPVILRSALEVSLQVVGNQLRHRARVTKELAELPPVLGDRGALEQVFVNLLLNAAQALPEGQAERNEIRVTARSEGDEFVIVEIADSGPAIPERDLDGTTRRGRSERGMGLSICHGVVTSLGGEVSIRSSVGEGTTVRLRLPTAAAPRPWLPRASSPAEKGRVLVVDDEPLLGSSIQRLLAPHEVVVLTSGRQAVEICRAQEFDVILCDLMMPDLKGWDVHSALGEMRPGMETRIVFLSGGAFTPPARQFLQRVPNERIEKPFESGALREIVGRRVRARRSAQG